MPLSRRRFVEALLAACVVPRLFTARAEGAEVELPVDHLRTKLGAAPERVREQHYRADATILLFSMPLYTRTDVGGGFATVERRKLDGGSILTLEFAAGSDPQKARGLNRRGFFQEIIVESPQSNKQAAYFGFMTSSPEETASSANQALDKTEGESTVYDAIAGHIGQGHEKSRRSYLDIVSTLEWDRFRQLAEQVEQGLRTSATAKEKQQSVGSDVGTFLHSVMDSAWSRREKCQKFYSYNGNEYRLETEREDDPKTAERLIADGVISDKDELFLLRGRIVNLQTNNDSKFKLWISGNGEQQLPARFEFKARSFLRIAFEAPASHAVVSQQVEGTDE